MERGGSTLPFLTLVHGMGSHKILHILWMDTQFHRTVPNFTHFFVYTQIGDETGIRESNWGPKMGWLCGYIWCIKQSFVSIIDPVWAPLSAMRWSLDETQIKSTGLFLDISSNLLPGAAFRSHGGNQIPGPLLKPQSSTIKDEQEKPNMLMRLQREPHNNSLKVIDVSVSFQRNRN